MAEGLCGRLELLFGDGEAAAVRYHARDLAGRINKLRGERFAGEVAFDVEGFSFACGELGEQFGFFDGLLEGGLAVLLQLTDDGQVLFHAALDAAFVESEELEVLAFFQPDDGLGEGVVDLLVIVGVLGGPGSADADGEDGAFEGSGTSESPTVIGDGLDEAGFERAFGSEGIAYT